MSLIHFSVFTNIMKCVEAREHGDDRIMGWGTGKMMREFLHGYDAARGIVDTFERYDESFPVNLVTSQEISIQAWSTVSPLFLVSMVVSRGTFRNPMLCPSAASTPRGRRSNLAGRQRWTFKRALNGR